MQQPTGPWTVAQMRAHLNPPVTLDTYVRPGARPQVALTMAGAQLAKVTDPQHRALATAATLGRVMRGRGGESITTLKALARKRLVTLVMRPGGRPHEVDHAVITPAGELELARLDKAAADQAARDARIARVLAFA